MTVDAVMYLTGYLMIEDFLASLSERRLSRGLSAPDHPAWTITSGLPWKADKVQSLSTLRICASIGNRHRHSITL
jgi:hypothetical protein